MLKTAGAAAAGALIPREAYAELLPQSIDIPCMPAYTPPNGPLTAIVIGAGNRGNVYASYAGKAPSEFKIAGFAEPNAFRSERFARKYEIPVEKQFKTWEDVFKVKKFADAVVITTPDALHYGPAMAALELGYDILLEKAIAQSWQQCSDIMNLAVKKNRIVAICHVLRYSPYFLKVKETIDSGALGRMLSLQLMEPVGNIHMSHSFVRGNWRNSKESNPMLLSKSCHDLDLLLWFTGKHCLRIGSYGSLTWFKQENAPAGCTKRCTDGCAVESQCPYSALNIYYRKRRWLYHMDLPETGDAGPVILENLKSGPYGRCVFHCDNDVVDHQVVSMEFEDGITANFNMEGHTSYAGRRLRIMGSEGDLTGDETDLLVSNFRTGKTERWNVDERAASASGHGGGDYGLIRAFIRAVSKQDPAPLSTTIASAMESHLMGFRAEEARAEGTMKTVGAAR